LGPDEYVHKRKKRYMAQVLESFEEKLEPALIGLDLAGEVQNFKGLVRARMNALATDAVEVYSLDGTPNGLALEVRDQLAPRP
jgi:hypothetical protein